MEKAITCTETDGNRLERQKTNRKPIHGAEDASKNRWRVGLLGTGKGGQRCETRLPALKATINIYIVYRACTRSSRGFGGGDKDRSKMSIKTLRFADDQAMVAKSQKGLQAMMNRLDATSREYGMRINIKKTKVLKISKGMKNTPRINIGGKEIEQVKEFCYLGSMIMTAAKCHREIKRRIVMGKEAFAKRENF